MQNNQPNNNRMRYNQPNNNYTPPTMQDQMPRVNI